MPRPSCAGATVALVLALAPVPGADALAQDAAPEAPVPAPAPVLAPAPAPSPAPAQDVQAPELLDFVEAEYPPEALAARRAGEVVLRLELDAEGRVTAAEVLAPAGHGFDEAARAAALRFRFSPARRGGVPVAARIRYRYEFHLPPPPPPPVAPDPSGPAGAPDWSGTPLPADAPIEVTVRGLSAADRRRQSAEAVTVIDTERAKRESSDLGEVLARTQGVGVRRGGGLGSSTRFSLGGLTDDQVRFFLDGVPLELAGYPFGIANVPVNLVERVEIYSGVVPVRLGADALGGAVDLVTDRDRPGAGAAASYEVGSFDTHRLTVAARTRHASTGLVARAAGFLDSSRNNYPIDVEVPDELGRLAPARVYRFHDGYRAVGGNAGLGVADRPWAKRLVLRAFVTDYSKDYQHGVTMTVPFGGVTYGEAAAGATLRYEQPLGARGAIAAVGGYTFTRATFVDVSTCVYDWFGRCIRERAQPGETNGRPLDQVTWEHAGFARVDAAWRLGPSHALRVSSAPTYMTRTGDERRQSDPDARDLLSAERALFTLVNGVEYEIDRLGDRLESIAFVKQYVQRLDSEEPLPGEGFRRRDRTTRRFGAGEGLRLRVTPWLHAKASYEWATRLPRADEVFGDGAFVVANLALGPEQSHNLNLGAALDARATRTGSWRATATAILREADDLVVLLGNERAQSYQNVLGARSLGAEAAAGWTSPGEHVALDGNVTYQDFRNTARGGTFGDFVGDRIPNRPYLFATGSARVQRRGVFAPRDEIALAWTTRYVHGFFRGWESIGLRDFKQVVPAQLVHSIGIGYLARDRGSLSTTLEIQNLTDEPVFDFFGIQRPGRAFFVKTAAEL
jgi:TonB family protein